MSKTVDEVGAVISKISPLRCAKVRQIATSSARHA